MKSGGLASLVPLIGLGAVLAIVLSIFNKKRTWFRLKGLGWRSKKNLAIGATTGVASTACATNCATVGFNEKLVAAERLPGVKYREVDVITRKRVRFQYVGIF